MWNMEIPSSRLQNLLSVGFIVLVFGIGVSWQQFQQRVATAQDKANAAAEIAQQAREENQRSVEQIQRDLDEAKRGLRRLEEKTAKQDWMTYKILKKVDPAAANMIPQPPEPR